MLPQQIKCGKPQFANPRKRESPARHTSPKEKFSWASTVRTTPCAERLQPTTQRAAKKSGVSGPFPAILQSHTKQKNWKWQRRPGTAKVHGKLVAGMSGTPSPTTTRRDL